MIIPCLYTHARLAKSCMPIGCVSGEACVGQQQREVGAVLSCIHWRCRPCAAGSACDAADMSSVQAGRSVFLQLFQARCSETDLGPISVNWFEELTAEAAQSQPRLYNHEEMKVDGQFDHCFKTPKQKQPYYSQLDSTPTIFKEQCLRSPLFLSPTRDQCKNHVVSENMNDVNKPERISCDNTGQLLRKEVFGSSSISLADSPVAMKEIFKTPFWDQKYTHRTPQRDGKIEICDSLFCTPKLIRNQTPKSISEILGAEADSDISWSSSLATPPSPTVIIAQANYEAPKMRTFDKKDAVIVQSLFSKLDNAVQMVSLAPPSDTKVDNDTHTKMSADSAAPDKTGNCAVKAADSTEAQQEKTVLNVVQNEDGCQGVGTMIEGMEDVLSIFFSEKRRNVKIDHRIKRRNRTQSRARQNNALVLENIEEEKVLLTLENPLGIDNHKYSKCRQGNEHDGHQKTSTRELSSSYDWSPLNLPDFNTTQEENLPIDTVCYGCANIPTCSNSQPHSDDCTSEANCTRAIVSNIHSQDRCALDPSQTTHHEKGPDGDPACRDTRDFHSLDGLVRSSSIAANHEDLWKHSDIANHKVKTVLSTLKRQTKFLYSLNSEIHNQDSECAKHMDGTTYHEPSNSPERPDAQIGGSQKALDMENAACVHSQPEVQLFRMGLSEDFKNDSVVFHAVDERVLDINQTETHSNATDTTTSVNTLSVESSITTTVGGLARKLAVTESLSISAEHDMLCDNAAQRTNSAHSCTNESVLCSDVTGDLHINRDTKRRPANSSCRVGASKCTEQDNSSELSLSKRDFDSANKTCNLLYKTNVQDLHISEEHQRKVEPLATEDSSLYRVRPIAHTTVDSKDSLEVTPGLDDPALAMIFKGFKTASHKEIVITESKIAAGSLLFKDIEDTIDPYPFYGGKANSIDPFPKTGNMKPDQDETANRTEIKMSKILGKMPFGEIKEKNQKLNIARPSVQSYLADGEINSHINDQSKILPPETNQSIKKNTASSINCTPAEINPINLLVASTKIHSHFYDILTESQKAEVNELSSILENADSQFDFTQVKKVNIRPLNRDDLQIPKESVSESQKLNNSDVWKDVDFNDSFATEGESIENNVSVVTLASESNSHTGTHACGSAHTRVAPSSSMKQNKGIYGEFSLASGKSICIADEGLAKAIKLFSDLDDIPLLPNYPSEDNSRKRTPELNCLSVSESIDDLHANKECSADTQGVNGILQSTSPCAVESCPEIKEQGLIHSEPSVTEQSCFKNSNLPEMENSDLCGTSEHSNCSVLAECVPICDTVSSGYGKPASALPIGFATGRGKLININKSSLEKARSLFNDILEPSDKCEDLCRTRTVHGSSSSLLKPNSAIVCPSDKVMETTISAIDRPPVGFSTISYKDSLASSDSLQGEREMFKNMSRKEVNKNAGLPQEEVSIPKMACFSTAGGKPVQLSNESLKRAREMFAEIDDMQVAHQQTPVSVWAASTVKQSHEGKINPSNLQELQKNSLQGMEKHVELLPRGVSAACSKNVAVSHNDHQVTTDPCTEGASGVPPSGNIDLPMLNIPISKMTFFNTAGGKPVHLSNESLKKAREMFADLDNSHVADQEKDGSSVMQREGKVKPRFLNTNSLQDEQKTPMEMHTSNLPPLGFSTASGKTVAVSHESLQKSRLMFSDSGDMDAVSETEHRFLPPHVNTGKVDRVCGGASDPLEHNKRFEMSVTKVNRGKVALNQTTAGPCSTVLCSVSLPNISDIKGVNEVCLPPQESPISKMACFTTARGNPVHVSDEALKKAKEMYAEIDDGQIADLQPNVTVWPGSKVKQHGKGKMKTSSVSNGNLEAVQKHTVLEQVASVDRSTPAFSTASGKTVVVSADSLQKAKLMFADTDNTAATEGRALNKVQGSSLSLGAYQVKKTDINRCLLSGKQNTMVSHNIAVADLRNNSGIQVVENDSVPRLPYFSTASGRSVTMSEESLKKAREMFCEIDSCSSQHGQLEGPLDNHSKWITKTEKPNRERLQKTSDLKYSPDAASKNSLGFSTASGKQVCVSESALQKVKGLFDEFSTIERLQENSSTNHESTQINVLTPITNKPEHTADSITKIINSHNDMPNSVVCDSVGTKSDGSFDVQMDNIPLPMLGRHSTPFHGTGASIAKKLKSNLYFTSSQTPENDFELEAAESAKAFMNDEDLTDAEIRTEKLFLSPDKAPNIRNGKRLRPDDGIPRGEPPIKRQLLPEFDRSLENESILTLKPLTSSPGNLKDRRRFLYSVSLKPLSCDPESFSKGRQDAPVSKLNTQNHFHAKSSLFQRSLAVKAADRKSPSVLKTNTGTLVQPFKKKLCMVSDDQTKTPTRQHSSSATENPLTEDITEVGISYSGNNTEDYTHLVPNLRCARDMQEMRIRKKQRCKIRPHPGSLYRLKTSSADRISLVSAVGGRRPTVYTKAQLYRLGVVKNHIGINSERARTFEFHCRDYFSMECLLPSGGVQIADGGWLVPSDTLTAGRLEFYRALCDTPGVDPKLISPEWVFNHYRWIVWKLAAMEVMFPEVFASRCLTPDRVLLQLKYRYDVEIDQSRRSAIRRIMERDDTPAKTLVLCVSKIFTQGNGDKSEGGDAKQVSVVIEVTDGWYGIRVLLDTALTSLLRTGRMFVGQKIIVHAAELIGSEDACTPLEAPDSLMLKIAANSTRPACWYTRLGYYSDPRPFCLRLSSLFAGGGIAGCVDVVIQRIYPMQWMEKMANGTYVFRNERAEEREAERHSAKQQKNIEILFGKIQEQFEQQEACARGTKGSKCRSLSGPQISALQDGAEIYEAIYNEPDPDYLESCLSSEQLRALNHHRQTLNDRKQAQIQADFRKAIESAEQGASGCARRDVTPVWKMRIMDYKQQDDASACTLNIWRPLPDVMSLLKEGGRFKMYQLAASQSKSKSTAAGVQLTATKKTQFQQLQASQNILEQIYTERQVTEFSCFLKPDFTAAYGEVDVVGLVISTQQKTGAAPMVYLSDETYTIVAIKFWTDLAQLSLEELSKPCTFIAASNLHWRSEYVSGIPIVFAGDLSVVVANPKEHHLQKAIQKLRHSVQSVQEYCSEAELKLMNVLQVRHPEERRSLYPHTPMGAGGRSSTPVPSTRKPQMNPAYTPDGNNTVCSKSSDMDVKTCKKMKGLDFLVRIPSPPPLTPVRPIVSPSLQREFRPPRSLQKEVLISGKPFLNTATRSPINSESGFVGDDELAMINTQGLVSGSEARKIEAQPETCRSVSEVSDGDLQKDRNSPNHLQKMPKPLNSKDPPSADSDKTKEEGHLIYPGKLRRKTRHKR
ncbi:breast cancer type 2 susceptibility protein [Pseudophryne corroboree]|uniref:breast cancer type 2 susceptibility protein n=1 Tax=Pseudophryne corroboree TaxID=495146 RepID=UPI003081C549